jgi:hypothetical protein
LQIQPTHLLRDDPSETDEFGTHSQLAEIIKNEIAAPAQGRSIAVVGEWGSGKSTVIKLLSKKLGSLKNESDGVDAKLFIYDAWAHQGDPLRRAFLDDLISFFETQSLLPISDIEEAKAKVWNREEITETVTDPTIRKHTLLLILSLALVPLGMKLMEFPSGVLCFNDIFSSRNLVALGLIAAPLPLLGLFGLINWAGPSCLRRFLFGTKDDQRDFSVLSFFFEKCRGSVSES